MGTDIHVTIVKFNYDLNKFEEVKLYRKNNEKYKPVEVFPGRDYELFDILLGKEDSNFPSHRIHDKNLPKDLIEKIEENEEYCFGFSEVNLAEVKLYLKNFPKIRNYDYEGDEEDFLINGYKENPVTRLIKSVENILDLYDPLWNINGSYACIKILYWFDN